MKIVIDIPDQMYERVLDGTYCGTLYEELKNGTPLPKGHGRLGDFDAFERFCTENEICNSALDGEPIVAIGQASDGDNIWKPLFDYAQTIIERDGD